jgi:hypothetical protein
LSWFDLGFACFVFLKGRICVEDLRRINGT